MHGLDTSIDLSFVVGRILLKARQLANQIQMDFDADVHIYLECKWLLKQPGRMPEDGHSVLLSKGAVGTEGEVAACHLSILEGLTIQGYSASRDGTLELRFQDGTTLTLFDHPHAEAYQITAKGIYVVV